MTDNEISKYENGLVVEEMHNEDGTDQKDKDEFDQNSKGYYRWKTLDKSVNEALKTEFEKYVTDEKLEECCHKYDTNVNKSLNNICAKYASESKHFGNSIDFTCGSILPRLSIR